MFEINKFNNYGEKVLEFKKECLKDHDRLVRELLLKSLEDMVDKNNISEEDKKNIIDNEVSYEDFKKMILKNTHFIKSKEELKIEVSKLSKAFKEGLSKVNYLNNTEIYSDVDRWDIVVSKKYFINYKYLEEFFGISRDTLKDLIRDSKVILGFTRLRLSKIVEDVISCMPKNQMFQMSSTLPKEDLDKEIYYINLQYFFDIDYLVENGLEDIFVTFSNILRKVDETAKGALRYNNPKNNKEDFEEIKKILDSNNLLGKTNKEVVKKENNRIEELKNIDRTRDKDKGNDDKDNNKDKNNRNHKITENKDKNIKEDLVKNNKTTNKEDLDNNKKVIDKEKLKDNKDKLNNVLHSNIKNKDLTPNKEEHKKETNDKNNKSNKTSDKNNKEGNGQLDKSKNQLDDKRKQQKEKEDLDDDLDLDIDDIDDTDLELEDLEFNISKDKGDEPKKIEKVIEKDLDKESSLSKKDREDLDKLVSETDLDLDDIDIDDIDIDINI